MMHYTPSGADASVINRGDFNNDGIPDIITGNNGGTGGYGVSVNLGIGDGRFQNPINSAFGMGTFDMAIGDFNGDGKLDVALLGFNSIAPFSIIQIMLGNGTGSFTKGQTIKLGGSLISITTGDFNGDGKLDLAMASDITNKVYLYKGAGNGTFSNVGTVTVGSQPSEAQVRVGDFNGDGKVDLMVSDNTTLWVLWNTGNFTFSPVQVASAPDGVYGTPVDANQDNFTDLVVTEYNCQFPGCTTWEVLLGSANKTFKQSAVMTMSSPFQGLTSPTAADINGDGINDIVGITNGTQPFELVAWLGNPDGSYQSTPLEYYIGTDSFASDLVASDFNRDGKIDFAIATPRASLPPAEVSVFLNATPRATCTPNQESPTVTVCQPQDLTYLKSPVEWIADSRDTSHPVTAMQIYVDNKLVVNSPSSSLNERLNLSKGPHLIVTKAWDSSGANFRSDHTVTIYSGTQGETCPAAPGSIDVCLPTQNQVTSTFLHVFANADSTANQITAVQVYIDGKLVYNDTTGATYVDTAFTVAKGHHLVVVKAWDANGNVYSQTRTVMAQ